MFGDQFGKLSKYPNIILAVVTALVLIDGLLAADWPQWRGPTRDGISKETGLLQEWPDGRPEAVVAKGRPRRWLFDAVDRRRSDLPH